MDEETTQAPPQDTHGSQNPDQSAAALSFATMLSEGLMPQAPVEAPQEAQEAPVSPESAPQEAQTEPDTNTRLNELEARIFEELDDIKSMVKKDSNSEVEDIKKQLEEIINE